MFGSIPRPPMHSAPARPHENRHARPRAAPLLSRNSARIPPFFRDHFPRYIPFVSYHYRAPFGVSPSTLRADCPLVPSHFPRY